MQLNLVSEARHLKLRQVRSYFKYIGFDADKSESVDSKPLKVNDLLCIDKALFQPDVTVEDGIHQCLFSEWDDFEPDLSQLFFTHSLPCFFATSHTFLESPFLQQGLYAYINKSESVLTRFCSFGSLTFNLPLNGTFNEDLLNEFLTHYDLDSLSSEITDFIKTYEAYYSMVEAISFHLDSTALALTFKIKKEFTDVALQEMIIQQLDLGTEKLVMQIFDHHINIETIFAVAEDVSWLSHKEFLLLNMKGLEN